LSLKRILVEWLIQETADREREFERERQAGEGNERVSKTIK